MGRKDVQNPNHSSLSRLTRIGYDDIDGPEKACNCTAILEGKPEALNEAKILTMHKSFIESLRIPDHFYVNASKDCTNFKMSRKYLTFPLSREEEHFPLAYAIVVHHKAQNFERLLRAIYAPQNIYCIHVDLKAAPSFFDAISSLASCFPNVFMVSRREKMIYNSWSRVQADINCMADLMATDVAWKYFINLCGQDFPIKTNLDMVRKLRVLDGANSMESEAMSAGKSSRVQFVHKLVDGYWKDGGKKKGPPPFQLPIFTGNAYILVSRAFVLSVLEDHRILALIEWTKDTFNPEETIWATIQRMPGVPGSTWTSSKYDMTDMNAMARLVKWSWHEGERSSRQAVYPPCQGSHVRGVCVYGAGDLHWMVAQQHFFANKFDTDTDPVAIYCLEKYLRQRVLAQLREEN
nr:beta-1,3-galactosyl-O-glycosyl-glycoprotein beta-1,6-N-acetylglucosaminyltransferase-like [Nerophis lumbriciformis]